MAIFGGKDIELPIITQLMQVDTNNAEEMREFWLRCYGVAYASMQFQQHAHRRAFSLTDLLPGEIERHDKESFAWRTAYEESQKSAPAAMAQKDADTFSTFTDLCKRIQDLFEGLCGDKTINYKILIAVRKSVQLEEDRVVLPKENPNSPASGIVPFDALLPANWHLYQNPNAYIAYHMERLLLSCWRGIDTVIRCEECKSVWFASRLGGRFCSYRCTARVGQRRRRAMLVDLEKQDLEKQNVTLEKV